MLISLQVKFYVNSLSLKHKKGPAISETLKICSELNIILSKLRLHQRFLGFR
jgi:hypothetical protein